MKDPDRRPQLRAVPTSHGGPDGEISGARETDAPTTVEAAFRLYAPYVAAVALRLLGRDDEVDDVVQEVFLASVTGLKQLRDRDALRGWLATVAVRVARRKLYLRKFRSLVRLDDMPDYAEVATNDATPEDRALLAMVYAILDELPVNERIAWTLRHVEGERLDAVARLCGCSLATAKRRIQAAQAVIEKALGHD